MRISREMIIVLDSLYLAAAGSFRGLLRVRDTNSSTFYLELMAREGLVHGVDRGDGVYLWGAEGRGMALLSLVSSGQAGIGQEVAVAMRGAVVTQEGV